MPRRPAAASGHQGTSASPLTHPQALPSMVRGWVPAQGARRHAPAWDTTNRNSKPPNPSKGA